jgi:hypothetical protein
MFLSAPALVLAGMVLASSLQEPSLPGEPTFPQEPVPVESSFQWIQGARVAVAFRGADSLRARRIQEFLDGLPPLPGLPNGLPRGLSLFIAPTQSSFDSLTGGAVPEWGAGVAIPELGRMVVPAFGLRRTRGWDEARVLRHEWAHLGLHQYLPGLQLPKWFDEGYAEWSSGGWNAGEGWRLRVAFAMGRAPPLDSLALGWPRDRASAELAYLLSATAVEYLVRESGERGLRLFLERWEAEGRFETAMRGVYGLTLGQFEEDWKTYVRKRYGWVFVLSHSSVFWLTLTFSLLFMVRIRRGRDREALARLRAGEPPDQPAYWEESAEGTKEGPVRSTEEGVSSDEGASHKDQ